MYLADPVEIRKSLGFDDMTDINDAITTALDSAEAEIASVLQADFTPVTGQVDTFFIETTPTLGGSRQVRTELLLSKGFVSGTPVVVAAPSTTGADWAVRENVVGSVAPTPAFTWDNEIGAGIDLATNYDNMLLTVTYDCGFPYADNNSDPPISYDLSFVPKWLQDAAVLMTLILLADAAVITEANVTIDKKMTANAAQRLLSKKVRYRPRAFDPVS